MTTKTPTSKSSSAYPITKALKIIAVNIVVFLVLLELASRIYLSLRRILLSQTHHPHLFSIIRK